ncbi:MAG: ABC transporter ATP-binding protein [bacterium]
MSLLLVEKLEKHFGGLCAVAELSFEVKDGEILGLIGPNGAGKTTVFNCLTGFLPIDQGQVRFKGRSMMGLKPHQICRLGMTRTFQIVRPFLNVSVLDNVMVGAMLRESSLAAARRLAQSTLELAGLESLSKEKAGSLPLALRKRLELARALATRPELLLLDEVMGGLNPRDVDEMVSLLKEVHARGVSILLIEHVMRGLMALAQRVVVINYGRKISEGAPQEVVRDPQVVEAYLGREFLDAGN